MKEEGFKKYFQGKFGLKGGVVIVLEEQEIKS